jgi:hypothetical protein
MLRHWANALANPKARITLLLLGVLATVALGPMSVFGAYMLLMSLFSEAQDKYHFLGWSLVGTAALLRSPRVGFGC